MVSKENIPFLQLTYDILREDKERTNEEHFDVRHRVGRALLEAEVDFWLAEVALHTDILAITMNLRVRKAKE